MHSTNYNDSPLNKEFGNIQYESSSLKITEETFYEINNKDDGLNILDRSIDQSIFDIN